jgi:hypothetical protein
VTKHDSSIAKKAQSQEPQVSAWLWRGAVGFLVAVMAAVIGVVFALALGWRSTTPHRAPDWTAADLMWEYGDEGLITASKDGYQFRLTQPHQWSWAVADLRIADFELELETRSLIASEDVDYGVLFRYQSQSDYYLFGIGGDGYFTIAVVRHGELTPLRAWQQWPHVRRGAAANRLRVRCQGGLCRFYVNDEFTAEVIDESFLAGNMGIWAQSFSDRELNVVFSGLRVWSLDQRTQQP